jgi:hypothetical protein
MRRAIERASIFLDFLSSYDQNVDRRLDSKDLPEEGLDKN